MQLKNFREVKVGEKNKGRQECQPYLLTNPLNSDTKLQIRPTLQN